MERRTQESKATFISDGENASITGIALEKVLFLVPSFYIY